MKFLTKIVMVVALATFSFQSFAQTFGVKAGMNMSKMALKGAGKSIDNDMLMGFHVGVTGEMEIASGISVESGLIFSTKGNKFETPEVLGIKTTTKSNPSYLEIPVNAKYALDLGQMKMYFAAGPYVGFGIAGKTKYEAGSISEDEKIKWGDELGNTKRVDFGLNFGAGIDFGQIGLGVQYGLGLSNTMPKGDSDNYSKNRVISISLAYKLSL